MRVRNKKEWYALQKARIFNTTWNGSVQEFAAAIATWPVDKIFCIRTMGGGGGEFTCKPKVELMQDLAERKIEWKNFKISEQAPDDAIQVQGEFDGEVACITFEKIPMRLAFRKSEITVSRVQLLGLIGYEYYRYLKELLEDFEPGAVVEFSLYSRPVGIFKERMIIWEIRHY
jgi:hypothetical protein